MKKATYEIEKGYLGNNLKVYKPNRLQRLLSSIETVNFFELGWIAIISSVVSLVLSTVGAIFVRPYK